MAKGFKAKEKINSDEFDALIKGLSHMLEEEGSLPPFPHTELEKLTLNIKKTEDGGEIKLKVKTPSPAMTDEEIDGTSLPKYSRLKKEMKKTFAALKKELQQGLMPNESLVTAFTAQSALMVRYPGKGDEYYDQYEAFCDDFAEAAEQGDTEAMYYAWQQLNICMDTCHKKYK